MKLKIHSSKSPFDSDQKYASVVIKFLFPDLVIYDLIQVHLARSGQSAACAACLALSATIPPLREG